MSWSRTTTSPDPETLVASLAGVVSAHVVRGPSGRIIEIHVLSAAELSPKQVVRNVESALRAGLGLEVDRRMISVAQIRTPGLPDGDADGGPPPTTSEAVAPSHPATDPAVRRLEYVRYHSRRQGERCNCEVVLRDENREVAGVGEGHNTREGWAEAAGRAVFDAIGKARPDLRLQLDGTMLTSVRGRTFVIAAARLLQGRDSLRLAGAAAVSRSPEEAAILASLQATNRWSG